MSSEEFRTYLFSYNFDGNSWSFEVKARTAEEAKARVQRIGAWANYDGELMCRIRVPKGPFTAWLALKAWMQA